MPTMKQDRATDAAKVTVHKATQATHDMKEALDQPDSIPRPLNRSTSLDDLVPQPQTRSQAAANQELGHARSSNELQRLSKELAWSRGECGGFSGSRKHSSVVSSCNSLFCSNESIEDIQFKKLASVNTDLYKMWQVNQTENAKLRVNLIDLKQELESSRQKLENCTERVSESSALYDTRKQEKEEVVARLTKMEKELKVLAVSENITDQTLEQLKVDNSRLRSENRNLVKVVTKLSK